MKVLIIDNKTLYLSELKNLFQKHTVKTVQVQFLDLKKANDFDLIVLSGSSLFPVLGNEKIYQNEINLIKNFQTPIIGICLGFELIGSAFGAHLTLLSKRENGIVQLKIIKKEDPLFDDLANIQVYEGHRWVIQKPLPRVLIALAKSQDGIEIIKHRKRLIYGFQFHPEMLSPKNSGEKIFNNTLQIVLQKGC